MADKIIRTHEQFNNLIKSRNEKAALNQINEEAMVHADHAACASQAIKVVNSIRMDPFIKKVMTLRLIGPVVTGHERTHISIALELGATIDDVIQAEQAGLKIVGDMLQKVSLPDFIEKHNRNRAVSDAIDGEIKKQGKP